jgi:hypothetical protein
MKSLQKYISIIAVVVSVTSIIISYTTSRRAAITGMQPVLVFVFNRAAGWALENVGSGPALNIVYTVKDPQKGWSLPTRLPPLSKSGILQRLPSSPVPAAALGCLYTDIQGRTYTSIMENNQTRVSDRSPFPDWKADEIAASW